MNSDLLRDGFKNVFAESVRKGVTPPSPFADRNQNIFSLHVMDLEDTAP